MEKKGPPDLSSNNNVMLKLYVCGMSGRSMEAIDNIKKYCAQHLDGDYNLEIIDIYKNPEIASEQQLIFSPSLIKLYPLPQKILVGNFSDSAKVSRGLGIANKV